MKLKDVLKYEGYVEEALSTAKLIDRGKKGDVVTVPAVRLRVGRRLVEIPAHPVNVLE